MKEAVLVIIKPDGLKRNLVGQICEKFDQAQLDIVAMRACVATRLLAEKHYKHIKGQPFFKEVVSYLLGEFHNEKRLLAIVYCGENAIKKCRAVAGVTNPEEADPLSIRGAFGRITTKGLYENVVHVSSSKSEAEREIKLWFSPKEITTKLYPTKLDKVSKEKVWL